MGANLARSRGVVAWAAAAGLLAACALVAPPAAAGNIYTYIDERGVTHFSNVPDDPRYQPVALRTDYPSRRSPFAPRHRGYDGLILMNARVHDVPPALVKAVIAAESLFDPSAVSRAGAQGLMQLMPDTARQLGVRDPFRPDENVEGGTRYLRLMLDRYGDMSRALAAYNAGPTAVDQYGGVPPYPETRDYVKRVLNYYRHYDGEFGP